MRILIIGAVAAGTSAAAKARRNSESAEIVVYEKDSFISYSGCGMPYFLGDEVKDIASLTPRNPLFFKNKYNVDIKTMHEVVSINAGNRTICVKNLQSNELFEDSYDSLIIATGAKSAVLPIKGIDSEDVFSLRNINDMIKIKKWINDKKVEEAVIIGTGFIGLEVCENLSRLGIKVSLVEKLNQVTPGLDEDMAVHVQNHLESKGVTVYTGVSVSSVGNGSVVLSDSTIVHSDLTLIAAGVKPETSLAEKAGLELGAAGAIKVNDKMQTSDSNIYACGDCIEHTHLVTGKKVWRPLGSTANKTGRIAGDVVTGGNLEFRGILGTGIFRIFDLAVAQTGLSEREAAVEGYDVRVCHNIKPDHSEYLGGKDIIIKGIADAKTGRLLGVQIIGEQGVDKRVDVFVTAITFGAKVTDLFHLDLAYAPPFSTTKDPVMYTGMILDNAINRARPLATKNMMENIKKEGNSFSVIDTRVEKQYEQAHVENAQNIPHEKLREVLSNLNKEEVLFTYCNKGTTGNAAQNILINSGFKRVYNVSGGFTQYKAQKEETVQ